DTVCLDGAHKRVSCYPFCIHPTNNQQGVAMLQLLAKLFTVLSLIVAGPAWSADAQATDQPADSILVFDASGSMWGQIDGINKIVTAREVVSQLVDKLPANQRLGLLAYGHNRKGDCQDIEITMGARFWPGKASQRPPCLPVLSFPNRLTPPTSYA